jgi:type II secretory pathway pseudopilin PulG
MRVRQTTRTAFTIVELLVAAALIVFIMAILANVFSIGTDTMRHLRAQGDMMDQLRSAEGVIKRDLQANHFPFDETKTNGGVALSDMRTDLGQRPVGGFFRIRSTPSTPDGGTGVTDDQGIQSTRADATNGHLLHFTSILPGGSDENLFSATVSPPVGQPMFYTSPAAEIAYFLDPQFSGTTGGLAPLPLYNLIRRQRLVATDAAAQANLPPNAANATVDPSVISLNGSTVNMLSDLVDPNGGKRLGGIGGVPMGVGNGDDKLAPMAGLNGSRIGEDVLLSNVLSFEVKVLWTEANQTNPGARAFAVPGNTDYPFDTLQEARTSPDFDTGSSVAPIRVKALQLRLRVWDAKMKTARQITIVQDM